MSRFLGITRERVFSPGRVEDDAAILRTVAERLRQLEHEVTVIDGDDDAWPEPDAGTVVFAMCQGPAALPRLARWEARGVRIINRSEAILSCQRHRTVPALTEAGVSFPDSVLVDLGAGVSLPTWIATEGAWVKRGDVHATDADDVVFVNDAAAVRQALERFAARSIRRAVIQRHVPGTVVKFYAVRQRFFYYVPPAGAAVAAEVLRQIDTLGQQAARVLSLEVYGGDCVCDVTGRLTLIDLNDWPSYVRCRAEAATAIAAHLVAQAVAGDT